METKHQSNASMDVIRYNQGFTKAGFAGKRHSLYYFSTHSTIDGYRIYAEKHCVFVSIPKGHELAFGLREGEVFGHECLVVVTAKNVNPALFGRE